MRLLIVGAGLIGAHHALAAAVAGHSVTMLDRYAVPRGASSRNLGAIRLSGRAEGHSLEMSRFGLTRWRAIAERVPEIGFSPCGSITLLRDDIEIAVAEEYRARYRDSIDLEVVPGARIPLLEPAVTGTFPAALVCRDDATIAPGVAMPALVEYLRSAEGVDIRLGVEVRELTWRGGELLASTTGRDVHADAALVCTGDAMDALFRSTLDEAPLRRVRINAFEVTHHGLRPTGIVTDGSALRSFPGYREMPSARDLIPFDADGTDIEWVTTPSPERSLLVGATRRTEDWSGAPMPIEAERWLVDRTADSFGADTRFVCRRWSAGFVESTGDVSAQPYVTLQPMPGVTLITGLGLMGNTMAPAIARASIAALS
jgi:glycine/D-amino acid oxidase-like deaminating enzyme